MEQLTNQFRIVNNYLYQEFKSNTGAKQEHYAILMKEFYKLYSRFDKEMMYLGLAKKKSSDRMIRLEAELLYFMKHRLLISRDS
jgi:hypothetical protein